jgi:hypothetical protein
MSFVFERPDLAQVQGTPRTRSSPRRTHNKSRLGCQTCKKRRIKCDETTPKCGQCQDKGTECVYSQKPPAPAEKAAGQDPILASVQGLSITRDAAVPLNQQNATAHPSGTAMPPIPEPMPKELAKARILMHLELTNVPQSHPNAANDTNAYQRNHIPHLLDHFAETSYPWAGSPQCQRVLQTWGLTLAATNPFLMHGILAFAASHLQSLEPLNIKYRTAASLHYGLSLTGFAASLSDTVTSSNADALFACCYLHAMLAFHYKRRADEPQAKDNDFAWLRLMKGIPILQRTNILRPHLNKSLWMPVFVESGAFSPKTGPLPEPEVPLQAANPEIEALRVECGASPASNTDGDENHYATPIAHLNRLSGMKIDSSKIGSMMVFIGRMPEAYVQLLEKLDVRALKILRVWCDFATGVEQWWCQTPAREESERLGQVIGERRAWPTPESMG